MSDKRRSRERLRVYEEEEQAARIDWQYLHNFLHFCNLKKKKKKNIFKMSTAKTLLQGKEVFLFLFIFLQIIKYWANSSCS